MPALRFVLYAAIVLSEILLAQNGQWTTFSYPPAAGRYDAVHFVNPGLGWVANSNGEIWKTLAGGFGWQRQYQGKPYMRCIFLSDSLRGFAGRIETQRPLLRTVNSGQRWTEVANLPPGAPTSICGISGEGATIYASGSFTGEHAILKTTDLGNSWELIDMSAHAFNLIDIYFFSADSGFVVGGAPAPDELSTTPVILFTDDGGQSWTPKYTGSIAGQYCWKIRFLDRQRGVASVQDVNAAAILKTSDGGETWAFHEVPGNNFIQGIGFLTPNIGWVGGYGETSLTTDGGISWQLDNFGDRINRFHVFGDTLAYAVGSQVYRYNGSPTAIIAPTAPPIITEFHLRNYPNPFNPGTTIQYRLPAASPVAIRIFNALGARVRLMNLGYQAAGAQQVFWDGRDDGGIPVASGKYIYRLDAGAEAASRMMTLIR